LFGRRLGKANGEFTTRDESSLRFVRLPHKGAFAGKDSVAIHKSPMRRDAQPTDARNVSPQIRCSDTAAHSYATPALQNRLHRLRRPRTCFDLVSIELLRTTTTVVRR
jgi:hypothetical protein